MVGKRFIFLWAAVFVGSTLTRPALAVPPPCREAGILSLKVQIGALRIRNACTSEVGILPPSVLLFIDAAKEVHQALAQTLDATQPMISLPLFSAGINIEVATDVMGPLKSAARAEDRRIFYFVPPSSDGAIPLNRGVYAHEVTHLISGSEPLSVAPYIHELSWRSGIFDEMFADLVAESIEGTSISGDSFLPSCFSRARSSQEVFSFNLNAGLFTAAHLFSNFHTCCESSAVTAPLTEPTQALCQEYSTATAPASAVALAPLTDLAPRYFSEEELIRLSPHQLGLPLIAFLKSVGEHVGRRPLDLLLEATRSIQVTSRSRTVPLRTPFQNIRATLTAEQGREFDRLWEFHGMRHWRTIVQNEVNFFESETE